MFLRAITVCFFFLTYAVTGHSENLVIFGDDAYSPVLYLKNGKPAGVIVDLMVRMESLTGDHYDLQLSPWKRAYELATRGEGGVIGISYTEERSSLFDYSLPIYDDNIQIVTLKENTFPYQTLKDLAGKVVGGVNGASYGNEVDTAIANGLFSVDRDIGQAGRLRKLLAGRLDAAFIGNGLAGFNSVIDSNKELQDNRDRFAILPVPLTRDPLHLAFAKNMKKQAALERFDKALKTLSTSGELPITE